eukprot:scaffold121232_cov60-Attheya_sp.AAC.2
MLQDFFKHKKACTICDRRQTRVHDDENAGASGRYEGYGMFSTWVPRVQIETASIGDNSGG